MLVRLGYLIFVLIIGFALTALFRIPQVQGIQTTAGGGLSPLLSIVAAPVNGVRNVEQTLQSISELRAENAALRSEVDQLKRATVQLPEIQRENAQLHAQLGLRKTYPDLRWIVAPVVGYDSSNLVEGLIVNRGTDDGVTVGMTVIDDSGALVGRVVRDSRSTANILLISDVSSSVDALIQSSRAKGVVDGQRAGPLLMKYIQQGTVVLPGQVVITSGQGGTFPPGLAVGTITTVRQNDVNLFQEAEISPAAKFDQLEQVLIIINHRPVLLQ